MHNGCKNLVYIRGNHDQWLKDWLKYGKEPLIWTMQGGMATKKSYLDHPDFYQISKKHLEFLKNTKCYFIDKENRAYCHGGFNPREKIEKTPKQYLMWDRDLWEMRYSYDKADQYKEVFVGHTSIHNFSHVPFWHGNVCFMDTGGGWEGVLSIMDVDTKDFYQSDRVKDLYPETRGRN